MPIFVVGADSACVTEADTRVENEPSKSPAENLLKPTKKTFIEALIEFPFVGVDSDFERIQDN